MMFFVSPLYAQGNTDSKQDEITIEIVDGKEVVHTISEKPSEEDKDWPIIYHEITSQRDDETGEVYTLETIIREFIESDTSLSNKDCPEVVMKQMAGSSCTYNGLNSGTQTASGTGVQATVKQFSYKYCNAGDCNYYQPYKVERSWWRQNSGYSITSAWLQWGCSGTCLVCSGGTTTVQYSNNPITVGWNNNNTSYIYTTSIGWFPIMQKVDMTGSHITALSHSAQVDVSVSTP
jgi:hypothetical protein